MFHPLQKLSPGEISLILTAVLIAALGREVISSIDFVSMIQAFSFSCFQVAEACLLGKPCPTTWGLMFGLVLTLGNAPKKISAKYWTFFLPTLFSAVSLLWGSYWWLHQEGVGNHADCWQLNIVSLLFWAQFPLSIALIIAHKGYRLFVSALLVNQLWVAWWCTFFAAMTTTNTWI